MSGDDSSSSAVASFRSFKKKETTTGLVPLDLHSMAWFCLFVFFHRLPLYLVLSVPIGCWVLFLLPLLMLLLFYRLRWQLYTSSCQLSFHKQVVSEIISTTEWWNAHMWYVSSLCLVGPLLLSLPLPLLPLSRRHLHSLALLPAISHWISPPSLRFQCCLAEVHPRSWSRVLLPVSNLFLW